MASVVGRSRPRWASTICEACLGSLTVPRKAVPGSLRFISASVRETGTRRERAFYQSSRPCTGLSNAQTRLRRHSSTQTTPSSSAPPFISRVPPQAGTSPGAECARLTHRRLIALSGPDAAKFLQGLITNNVASSTDASFYAAFLDARGRMLWDVFIWTYPDLHHQNGKAGDGWACYIEVDTGEIDALVKHLKRHKLRSKVNIRVVEESSDDKEGGPDNVQVWAIWGSDKATGDLYESLVTIKDPRFIGEDIAMRRSLVRPVGTHASAQALGDSSSPLEHSEETSLNEYTRLRHLYGIPEGQEEIARESALPMEYNVDLAQGIDFKKGCYVGQELTIRTKHTGVVRKRILPVELSSTDSSQARSDSETQSASGNSRTLQLDPTQFDSADIKQLQEDGTIKKGRAAGKLISVCGNLGLALCRLEMMTSMKISAEGGSWKPGMEFGVADRDGNVVKVKPHLRNEWVTRVRDIWDKKRTMI